MNRWESHAMLKDLTFEIQCLRNGASYYVSRRAYYIHKSGNPFVLPILRLVPELHHVLELKDLVPVDMTENCT